MDSRPAAFTEEKSCLQLFIARLLSTVIWGIAFAASLYFSHFLEKLRTDPKVNWHYLAMMAVFGSMALFTYLFFILNFVVKPLKEHRIPTKEWDKESPTLFFLYSAMCYFFAFWNSLKFMCVVIGFCGYMFMIELGRWII